VKAAAPEVSEPHRAGLRERLGLGDERALETVFRELNQPLIAFAHSLVGDYDDAQDIVQRAVIRVWDGRAHLPADVSLRACLFRTTRCEAQNFRRPIQRRAKLLGELRHVLSVRMTPRVPDDTTHHRMLLDQIDRAVRRFPPAVRVAFWLKRVEGLSYDEIGHVQGIAAETARAQVKDGHTRLRHHIVDTTL
jgi:RNA polymerase sigma factor (sigma-70 family)